MPYFPKINLLFIHIPKTGGTTLEQLFQKYSQMKLYSGKGNKILPPPFSKVSLQHQTYNIIYKYHKKLGVNFNNKLKIIAVVRDPYNRIISDLFWQKLIKEDTSITDVLNIIKKYIKGDDYDNHNIPQYKFVTDDNDNLIKDIIILKTESLNNDMQKLGFTIKKNHGVGKCNNKNYYKYLNNDSIRIINNFYKKDFELFNYEMRLDI